MEDNFNEQEEYYGILMNKKNIDEGVYAYVPEFLLNGYIEIEDDEVYFIDDLENEYVTIHSASLGYSEVERVIGYIVSKKELIDSYPDFTIEEAKIEYFNEIIDYNHFGVLDLDNNRVKVIKFRISDLVNQLYNTAEETTLDNLTKESDSAIEGNINEEKNSVSDKSTSKEKGIPKINVSDMKKYFDKKIIGQEEAKKRVISTIYMNQLSDSSINKKSCLLVGPTGSGKTLIAETLGEYFKVPMISIDTTQLTAPGYVGASLDDYITRLVSAANGNIELAKKGIVVLDEIDKKGSEKNSDVSGRAVLNNLLPFIEGTVYRIKYNNMPLDFDTSNLTIFAAGAFTEVANSKAQKKNNGLYNSTNVGFNSSKNTKLNNQDIKYEKLEIEDFVNYGNIPAELMGRFTSIVQLEGHTLSSLKSILDSSSVCNPLLTEKETLKKAGILLKWTEGYIDEVAKKAIELKTGARSLKYTVENSIEKARWEALNSDKYSAIILTEKTVENNQDCTLIDKKGNSINLIDILNKKNKKTLQKTRD